jgi:hypothetical protein
VISRTKSAPRAAIGPTIAGMARSVVAVIAVVGAVGAGAWVRAAGDKGAHAAAASAESQATVLPSVPGSTRGASPAAAAVASPSSAPGALSETALMDGLRAADPATVLALVREGQRRYPDGAGAEERASRKIDALVQLDRIGEAHTEAMLFVQRHPSGPFSAHVMNLMGVHPRPPGAVPEPLPEADEGR